MIVGVKSILFEELILGVNKPICMSLDLDLIVLLFEGTVIFNISDYSPLSPSFMDLCCLIASGVCVVLALPAILYLYSSESK